MSVPVRKGIRMEEVSGMTMERLFSVEEAAIRLGGLSKYTIHAWLSSGK